MEENEMMIEKNICHYITCLIVLLGFCISETKAQSGEEEGMTSSYSQKSLPSPTAASFAKFEEVPVDLYTGVPKIAIPLYEFKHRDLSVPIVLRYHGGGIKASERAGWTGLGWNLDAGGVLTRVVRGLPDEQTNGYLGEVNYLKDNWETLSKAYRYKIAKGRKDGEPDLFSFRAPGISGKFTYQYNGEIGIIPKQDIKAKKEGNTWILTDKKGIKYTFGEQESSFMATESSGGIPRPAYSYISSWYLTKIESPSGEGKIIFNYASSGSSPTNTEVFSYQKLYLPQATTGCSAGPEPEQFTVTSTNVDSKYLKSIRADHGTSQTRIEFSVSNREDLLNEKKLDQIKVYIDDTDDRVFDFKYDYFNTNASNNLKRLKLDEVQEKYIGEDQPNISKPAYKFTYYRPNNLPSYDSFSIDHWGFYNGKNNATLIPAYYEGGFKLMEGADRSPDFSYGINGTLKGIKWPQGGTTTFEYEPHHYQWVGNQQVSEPVYGNVSETVPSLNGSGKLQDSRDFTLAADAKVEIQYSITGGNGVEPYAMVSVKNLNTGVTEFTDATGQGTISDQILLDLTAGNYRLEAERGFSGEDDALISAQWKEQVDTRHTKVAGGLRIKKITTDPGTGSVLAREFQYQMGNGTPSGVLVSEPRYLSSTTVSQENCSKWVFSSNSVVSLGSTHGSHIGYRRVITNTSGSDAGKIIHRYRSPYEIPDNFETSMDWKRGQLVKKTDLNSSNKKVHQAEYEYYFSESGSQLYDSAPATKLSAHLKTRESLNGGIEIIDTLFTETVYHVISGWTALSQEKKAEFDVSNQARKMTTTGRFFYGDRPSHLQLTRKVEINSDKSKRITNYTYAHEKNSGMQNAHMLSQPYKVSVRNGAGNIKRIDWTLWELFDVPGTTQDFWQPCGQWTGGPGLGTGPPSCN